ncbi:protein kinase domain-containing protein [Dictyobacter aurantiacus]|uniref:serine/threonine-protein kinase n=1 Tax=Dictyobacter aurantiacus TaxID=1936993 RepID=UPI000F845E0B|nr:serine/threonine-protein kinase [Dictyobacter aurantiacus]
MSNNYSSDSEHVLPISGAQPGQSGAQNNTPEKAQHGDAPSSASAAVPETEGKVVPRRLASGTVLSGGRYRIEKLIASGGMGAVYRAIDTRFNRPCAVKEMLDEFNNETERAQAVEWFSREATLLLDLNHPCIPRVRDFFAENGRNYLVMDFIDGHTLAEILDLEGNVIGVNGARGVTEARARSWMRQVSSVLSYLHSQNPPIIFRDLKPSNIMVTNRDEVKLIDFGIARTFQSQRQATVIMTLGYAPPEQLHGMPEPRSDIYALGATIHRLLTRHDAVNNKPNAFAFPAVRILRPDISPAFEQVVMKSLAPQLNFRWSSAAELERALINLPPITVVPPLASPIAGRGNEGKSGQQQGAPLTPGVHVSSPNLTPVRPVSSPMTGPAAQHITTAMGHLSSSRIEAAHDSVKWAHSLEPQNAVVHKIFGQVFARRTPPQPDLALQAYNRSLQLNPNDAETHKLIGDVWYFLRQNPFQAIPAYTQSLRLNPQDFESHDRLGQCFEKNNQVEPAIREYQEALRLAPTQPALLRLRLYFALGQLAMRANQWAVAENAFVQVLILDAAEPRARFLLSQVYEREGKLEDAFRECGYVINGPLGSTPAVQQLYFNLKNRLGR